MGEGASGSADDGARGSSLDGVLRGCRADQARRPCDQVLAKIPWDGRRVGDPERMTAAQFLNTIG